MRLRITRHSFLVHIRLVKRLGRGRTHCLGHYDIISRVRNNLWRVLHLLQLQCKALSVSYRTARHTETLTKMWKDFFFFEMTGKGQSFKLCAVLFTLGVLDSCLPVENDGNGGNELRVRRYVRTKILIWYFYGFNYVVSFACPILVSTGSRHSPANSKDMPWRGIVRTLSNAQRTLGMWMCVCAAMWYIFSLPSLTL